MNFVDFAKAVNTQFNKMAAENTNLYVMENGGDFYWNIYLFSFPQGTNPIYRQRTEHDCSTCRNFIKNIAHVVSIKDGVISTVWDNVQGDSHYAVVAKQMQQTVKAATVKGVFAVKEKRYGLERNFESDSNLSLIEWHHFWANIPNQYVKTSPGEYKGIAESRVQVFARGLVTLSEGALNTVLELIEGNNLYRGREFKSAVVAFKALLQKFIKSEHNHLFAWEHFNQPFTDIRNTVIGTLLVDLSEGVPLEQAVASFEAKVAPTNYRRPKALVTNRMIEEAMKTIELLGLEPSLHRRLARIEDLNVNDVVWVSQSIANQMQGSIKDILKASVNKEVREGQNISIQKFLETVAPSAKNMQVFFTHPNNLVTITTSDASEKLFSWNNKFAWSYNGDITDAIKDKVKAAGGNINAKLRVSLAWYNYDDLDISVVLPDNERIYFGNKQNILDVDMNAGSGKTREPVENLSFNQLREGTYRVTVHNYSQRGTTDPGFVIETEYEGNVEQYAYNWEIKHNQSIRVLEFEVTKNGVIFKPNPLLEKHGKSVSKWGLNTQTWVDVSTIFLSPNHWEDSLKYGNKHYFFIIKDCKVDGEVRGFYNEFLRSGLQQHKRTFELLGSKVKCAPADSQVSGLGFSETQNNSVLIKIDGVTYNVQF